MLSLRFSPESRHEEIFIVDEGHGGRVLQTLDAVGFSHNLYHLHTVQTELFPEVGGSELFHLRLELKSLHIQTRPCFFVVLCHFRGAVTHEFIQEDLESGTVVRFVDDGDINIRIRLLLGKIGCIPIVLRFSCSHRSLDLGRLNSGTPTFLVVGVQTGSNVLGLSILLILSTMFSNNLPQFLQSEESGRTHLTKRGVPNTLASNAFTVGILS